MKNQSNLRKWIIPGALVILSLHVTAQHHHHDSDSSGAAISIPARDSMHSGHQHQQPMTSAFSLSLPMSRNGSGTSWLPDNSPVYAYMVHSRKGWNFMFHGNIFLSYTLQNFNNDFKRGGKKFNAPNWVMGMTQKQIGRNGLFLAEAMLSLDRLVMGGGGYPLLLQTGETWQGEPLVDRQHPHDLFANLSVGYTHRINADMDVSAYFGYPGEPALGPPVFMHRPSAFSNPDATLGHHFQDATHIVFGVGTAGFRYKWLKAEGSIFTGKEPDENRYDFDKPRFDSYSYRLSVNPIKSLSLQFSQGFLKSPEVTKPDADVVRTTASLIHSARVGKTRFNNALVWGLNNEKNHHKENSLLWEGSADFQKNFFYTRYEWVERPAEALAIPDDDHAHGSFNVHALTAGYSRILFTALKTNLSVGGQLTLNVLPDSLENYYGSYPLSGQIYLRISPAFLNQ